MAFQLQRIRAILKHVQSPSWPDFSRPARLLLFLPSPASGGRREDCRDKPGDGGSERWLRTPR
jgi:hypothetical protein